MKYSAFYTDFPLNEKSFSIKQKVNLHDVFGKKSMHTASKQFFVRKI